jgi:hypothetical protein
MRVAVNRLHSRLERMRNKVREVIAQEAPGVPLPTLRASVCMPYPEDDQDLVFFYGDGVASHADFAYATSRLADLLREDGIAATFAPVTRAACAEQLGATSAGDRPERRLEFLGTACGMRGIPDSIVSCPLFSPAVVSFALPGAPTRAQVLVI